MWGWFARYLPSIFCNPFGAFPTPPREALMHRLHWRIAEYICVRVGGAVLAKEATAMLLLRGITEMARV